MTKRHLQITLSSKSRLFSASQSIQTADPSLSRQSVLRFVLGFALQFISDVEAFGEQRAQAALPFRYVLVDHEFAVDAKVIDRI